MLRLQHHLLTSIRMDSKFKWIVVHVLFLLELWIEFCFVKACPVLLRCDVC